MNRTAIKVLLAGIIAAILSPSVAAANITKIYPPLDILIVNQTTIFNGPSLQYHTPLILFLLMALIGLASLVLSIFLKPETPYDMIGYIAPVALAFSAIMSTGIDIKTSGGVSTVIVEGIKTVAIIENHTIYFDWLLTVFLVIVTIISIVNVMRIQKAKAEEIVKTPD